MTLMPALPHALLGIVGCFALSAGITFFLSRVRGFLSPIDIPNDRSLHKLPVPRSGGLAVMLAVIAASLWTAQFTFIPIINYWSASAVLVVLLVSWLDDHYNLAALPRMLAHLVAGILLVLGGLVPDVLTLPGLAWYWPAGVATGFTILYAVWMTNLFNFMDGMDGFAGGMATIGFGCMGILGWLGDEPVFALLNIYVAMASCGFLMMNFPPARIFLGDVGSSSLGMLAAVSSLWADHIGVVPLWAAILVFSPFIADATVTLISRLMRGENVLSAHKSHYYQRMVQMGWTHRRTVLWEYALMLLSSGAAILALHAAVPLQWAMIVALFALYVALMYVVAGLEKGLWRR